jgi:ophiobolin F synthase
MTSASSGTCFKIYRYIENEANDFTRAYFIMLEFSTAMRISDSDREIMKSIFVVVEECLLISQDYWSYDKEYQQWKSHGTPIFNTMHFLSQKKGLTIDEAREKVKNRILKLKVEYCDQKTVFYREHPVETIHLKRLIECFRNRNT